MKTADIEIILQGAREKFPGVRPRIISDNGPQFIARDFRGASGDRAVGSDGRGSRQARSPREDEDPAYGSRCHTT